MLPTELQQRLQDSEQRRQELGTILLVKYKRFLKAELALKAKEDTIRSQGLSTDRQTTRLTTGTAVVLSMSHLEMTIKDQTKNERQEKMKAEGNYLFARMMYDMQVEAHNSLKAQIRLLEMEAHNQI